MTLVNKTTQVSSIQLKKYYLHTQFKYQAPVLCKGIKVWAKGSQGCAKGPVPQLQHLWHNWMMSSLNLAYNLVVIYHFKNCKISPGWCGSVDWVPVCKPKGCQFDSLSGHMPGLWARSPARSMREATSWYISHTLMFSSCLFLPPFPLSKNK